MSEIDNINHLLGLLKERLQSSGKTKSTDGYGNTIYVDCDIFNIDTLVSFLTLSLSEFNQVPHFTDFTFEDDKFVRTFAAVLVGGATMYALASKSLIERGREFQLVEDNGISFVPPNVSELMNTQWCTLPQNHYTKLVHIKDNIKDYE